MPRQTTEYDNEMRGALFVNDKKGNEKAPTMTGTVVISGHEYRLAAWSQVSRKGDRYLSISVTDPDNYVPVAERSEQGVQDDLPF